MPLFDRDHIIFLILRNRSVVVSRLSHATGW